VKRPRQTPVADLAALQRDVDLLFDRLRAAEQRLRPADTGAAWSPPLDVYESGDSVVVVAEVPGLEPDALSLQLEGHALVLRGERHGRKPAGGTWLCLERPHGRFERRVELDARFEAAAVTARLTRGLLVVTLQRRQRNPRGIVIEVKRS
jgi:HSP20 family protein